MPKQTTTVERPWRGDQITIPKVAKGVLFICLDESCGETITNWNTAERNRASWTKKVRCPVCTLAMFKVIK